MQKEVPNYRVYGNFDADFSLNPVHVDDVNRSTEENDWYISLHRHDDLCHLVYFYSGDAVLYQGNNEVALTAPCFCLVPMGVVHGFRVKENIEGTIITVSGTYIQELLSDSSNCFQLLDEYILLDSENYAGFFETVHPWFQQLREEYTGRQLARGLSIRSLLGLILSQLARSVQNHKSAQSLKTHQDKNLWYYRQFQNLIGFSLASKKPITDYASELKISVTHLNRICQAVSGKSALQVVHTRMVSEAKINLAYTFQSVSEVAYKLGFDDVSYFSRFFKSRTGVSPRDFKERFRR